MMDKVNHVWWRFGCHRTENNILVPEPALEVAHRRIRLILAIGLGGMILLMLIAGIDAVRVLQGIRGRATASGQTHWRELVRWS